MPELPEVETIVRNLREGVSPYGSLLHRKILNSRLLWAKSLAAPSPSDYLDRIQNQTVLQIGRRGKFLIFGLEKDTLLIHLRMSGDIRLEEDATDILPHDRVILYLDSNLRLVFNDARKFGRIWLAADPEEVIGNLGLEPFDQYLTENTLFERLQLRKTKIKTLLLDQTFLAGLGNIYTDEALFRARIHPAQPSNTIAFDRAADLLTSIREVLTEGIRNNGASIDWAYRGGNYQKKFKVYRRTGLPCLSCQTNIQRILIGQRGTHFCPNCQRLILK